MRAVWNGVVLAESPDTVVVEGNHYFPPESVRWEYLVASPTSTTCPWKGHAGYYTVVVDGQRNADAAWFYAEPRRAAARIKGHVAFWRGVRIERGESEAAGRAGGFPGRRRPPSIPRKELEMAGQETRGTSARAIVVGVGAGIAGAVAMAMYAMVVSATYKHVGFFTPMYHIASTLISPTAMMTSMAHAAHGSEYYFTAGPALVGLMVHMMTGAVAGALFGALASRLRLGRGLTVPAGMAYGVAVMLANAVVGLPVAAHLFGGGTPISKMPTMVGWGTFTVEHAMFGLVLGIVVAAWARSAGTAQAEPARGLVAGRV